MVLAEARPKMMFAVVLVGFFAIFHGHAYGTELPPGQSGLLYSMGFVIATGILHGLGIALGLLHRWPRANLPCGVGGECRACVARSGHIRLVAADLYLPAAAVTVLAIAIGLVHGFLNGAALKEGSGTLGLLGIMVMLFFSCSADCGLCHIAQRGRITGKRRL